MFHLRRWYYGFDWCTFRWCLDMGRCGQWCKEYNLDRRCNPTHLPIPLLDPCCVTTSGVTHSLINTTLEIVNDAINIPYNIVTTTTVVKHYVALFEANAVTDKTDVELLTTVQSVANVDGTSGAIVSEEQLAAGPHDKTINMTFAINASGGATAVNIGTGYVVKVFTMNEGWESGGLGTTTNVPYDQTKSLETQLSEMGMNYASDVDHHFDASGTTASTTVITDGVSGTITTTNVTFGNDGEFGYFKQAALGKIQSVPLLYLPDEWTHVIVVKPNSGGYDGLNWYDGGNTYQIHIGNSGLKRIKINHYSGQVGYQDTSIVSDGTFVNFVCICVFTHNRTTNSGKHWIKWNNGSTDIFDTNTASSLNITATNFYYGRSDNSTFDGDFYELAVIKKYFSDDTELDQIGNYFYYKYYGGGPDSQSTTTNPSINVLTKEIPIQGYQWVNAEFKSVFGVSTGDAYTLRVSEFGMFGQKYSPADILTGTLTDRDISEDMEIWNGTSSFVHNTLYNRDFTEQFNGITAIFNVQPVGNYDSTKQVIYPSNANQLINVVFKLTNATSSILQIDLEMNDTSPLGIPGEIDVYFGSTKEEAKNKVNPPQTIDLTHLRSSFTTDQSAANGYGELPHTVIEINETSGVWEIVS